MSGPDDADQRWQGRPWLAGLLRAAIVGVPVLLAAAVTMVGTRLLPHTAGLRWWMLHGLVFVASVVVALVAEHLARRLLPVAMLLKLTLLFPDRAPSRFKVARKANAVRLLEESAARTDDEGAASTATAVLTLLAALTSHDKRTRGHAERVRVYAELLGEQLNLPPRDRDLLRWGALLHDIGKLEVAPSVLNKPGKPSEREWAMLRSHPARGARLAAALMPWLGEWGGSILEHHERFDGTGYPAGLSGSGISRAGRLIAVVDAYEVMTAARSYKRAMSTLKARQELADCAGTHFDPLMVKAFLSVSLPRLLWATGPLSFLVQVPFITVLRDAGTRAAASVGSQTVSMAGAAVLATAGTVAGSVLGPTTALAGTPSTGAPQVHASASAVPSPIRSSQGVPTPSGEPAGEPSAPSGTSSSGGSAAPAEHRVHVTSAPQGEQTSPDAQIAFTVSGGGGALCSIDSGPFGACTSPLPLHGLSVGEHRVAIRPEAGGAVQTITWHVVPAAVPAPEASNPQAPAPVPPAPQPPAPQPPTPTPTRTATPTPTPTRTATPTPTSSATATPTPTPTPTSTPTESSTPTPTPIPTSTPTESPTPTPTPTGTPTPPPPPPDTTAPTVTITDGPPALSNRADASVTFEVDDADARVTCSLDGAPATQCVNSWTETGLPDGRHTLQIQAVDAAGNVGVVTRSWTVDTTAPVIGLVSGPAPATADPDARVEFTVDDPAATVTCSLDGEPPMPCTSPWARSGLADGPHALTVTATDAAGNVSTAVQSWTVDRVPPDLRIDAGPPALTRDTNATVTWTAETGSAVTCSLDGGPEVPCTTSWSTTGLADGEHTLTVTATDAAGNASTAAHTWTVDTVAPTLTVDGGPPARTSSRAATVPFTAEPGATVTCSLDGATPASCSTAWTGSALPDGPHTLTLVATDAAGNTTTRSRTWTVDTVAPALHVTSSPSGTSGRSVTVTFDVDDPGATVSCSLNGDPSTDCSGGTWSGTDLGGGTQRLVLTATDDVGNSSVVPLTWTVDTSAPVLTISDGPAAFTSSPSASITYTVDDPSATVTCSLDDAAAAGCTSPLTLTGLADGAHTLVLTATDTNGNSSTTTRSWTVDTTAPVLSVTSAPPPSTNVTSAHVAFTVDDATAAVTCSLDGGVAGSCASPWTASGLSAGAHHLVLVATDAAGNSSSVTVSWTVDTTAPVIAFPSGQPSTTTGSPSISFTVDDPTATVTCSLDGGTPAACSSPWTAVGLANGKHTLTVSAVDAAGNTSTLSRTWNVDHTGPTISIASGPTEVLLTTYFQLSGPGDATFECSWDNGAWETCSANPSKIMGAGTHYFSARAYKADGLRGPTVTTTWLALLP